MNKTYIINKLKFQNKIPVTNITIQKLKENPTYNQQCHLRRQYNLVMNRDDTITCHHISVICWIYLFINGLRGPK
jgi:hypothetical protein